MNSTHHATSDRFHAWMHQINEACGSFEGRRIDQHFEGRLQKHQAGLISLSTVDMARVSLSRGRREIQASGADNFYAVLQLQGTSQIEQGEHRLELKPGDLTLVDASLPLDMNFHDRSRQISMILPRNSVEKNAPGSMIECATRICAQTPLAKLANQLMTQASLMENLGGCESQAILDAVISLLRPAVTRQCPPDNHERLFQKAVIHINQNIACESLSPESVAHEIGVSMRSLYRIFSKKGLVIAQYIRNRRLDCCAESLRGHPPHQKLSSLGYSWGFSDSSYFSTAFKTRFGVSPGEYRKRHAG
jgi:AraC family transcriptional activator of tynA and feaB